MTPELMVPDARTLFERASGRQIMVVGDLMIDEWIWGTVTRISPEAPVPVVAVGDHSFSLGGAGNVANNLRALRANVVFAGTVGDDAFASHVRDAAGERASRRLRRLYAARSPDDAKDADRRAQPAGRARRLGVDRSARRRRSQAARRLRREACGAMRCRDFERLRQRAALPRDRRSGR